MARTYLDHAATTPMVPEAIEAMTRELGRTGNASSLHGSGRAARRVVEEAREAIAGAVGAHPTELIFTSGGTESDNLAVKGGYWSQADRGPDRDRHLRRRAPRRAGLGRLAGRGRGGHRAQLPVDATGRLGRWPPSGRRSTPRTAVVSVMWANNEVGTLQPVGEVAGLAAEHGALSHSDAVQAVGHVAFDFGRSGLDLASFTAHKLGGPYGVGALLARREVGLTAVLHGGGQERDVRSGTLDVAAVAGFAAAVAVAARRARAGGGPAPGPARGAARLGARGRPGRGAVRERRARRRPARGDRRRFPRLPGRVAAAAARRGGHRLLDRIGVLGGGTQPSHVLTALGASAAEARSALRFSLGHTSTPADVAALAAALPEAVRRARAAAAYA